MAAPIGNQFWKLRLKHGRYHVIATPEELWENFEEYASWLEENPLMEVDYRGKDANKVLIPKMRPFTKDSFALACGLTSWEKINNWRSREGFEDVITRIEAYIFKQKFEGAAAGFFKENIIIRDLGMAEKRELEIKELPTPQIIFQTPIAKSPTSANGEGI